ncbi:MAG: TatD family hydrolase [bacterium]
MLIDTHIHLTEECYQGDLPQVLKESWEAGVTAVIIPGCDLPSSLKAVEISASKAESGRPRLFSAVGFHPHEAIKLDSENLSALNKLLSSRPKPVAVGEIGLDYHYNLSPPEIQRDVFRHQIRLAREWKLPVILHCREAEEDLFSILEEERASECGGVIHCFSGNRAWAEKFLDKGYYLGITGVVTFSKAEELRSVVRSAPLSRLLTETDGPYLVPQPHRGKIKRNVPSFIPLVVARIAEVRGLSMEETASVLLENAHRLFGL